MSPGRDRQRRVTDVGSESPPSKEAKRQAFEGSRGGPQEARQRPRVAKQPPQGSGRRSARHEHVPYERKTFRPGEAPSMQGAGEPGPEQIATHSGQQGITPRSGSHGAHGERAEELARQGPPHSEHARHGRQHVPPRPRGAQDHRR